MDYKQITHQIIDICHTTGRYILTERSHFDKSRIAYKGLHDMVSYVDKQSEKQIVEGLIRILPEAGFITEENTINKIEKNYNWIVDPLDGTTNYIHGVSPFCISIALKFENEIVAAVVYEMNLNEMFYAWKGGSAYLNGSEIHVSATDKIDNSLLATGFPYQDYTKLESYMSVFKQLMFESRGLRRFGSAAADLVYTACGRMDGFFEYGLKSWDVAAGAFIVERAGGQISAFSNAKNWLFDKEIIAGNPLIHEYLYQLINSKFKIQ